MFANCNVVVVVVVVFQCRAWSVWQSAELLHRRHQTSASSGTGEPSDRGAYQSPSQPAPLPPLVL